MEEFIITNLSIKDLSEIIEECIQKSIQHHLKEKPESDERLLSVEEIADYLGVRSQFSPESEKVRYPFIVLEEGLFQETLKNFQQLEN